MKTQKSLGVTVPFLIIPKWKADKTKENKGKKERQEERKKEN